MNSVLPEVIREDAVPPNPLALAISRGAGIETIERLVALQERMDAERSRREYFAAFAKLQAELPQIEKCDAVDFTSAKGRTHYRFAKLERIAAAVQPVMTKHGFSKAYSFNDDKPNIVRVTCIITHAGGHSESTSLDVPYDGSGSKNEIQARGSSAQYGMRYTLIGALGLVTCDEDTDGHTAEAVVSEAQLKALRNGILDTETDERKVLAFAGVARLEDFPAAKYAEAMQIMRRKAGASK